MKSWFGLINLILAAVLLAGCETTGSKKDKKEASVIRLYLESAAGDVSPRTTTASVFREHPYVFRIQSEPALTEGDLDDATLSLIPGGYAIKLQFNRHGTWLLESLTTTYKGRHFVIFANFGQSRWLAAPIIDRRITDGVFAFTPDATREEAERLVRGLVNMIAEIKKNS